MPRYTVTLRLSLETETQQEAGAVADQLCYAIEDILDHQPEDWDAGSEYNDLTLRPIAVSWPEDSDD